MKVQMISGQMEFKKFTSSVKGVEFESRKIRIWLNMLNDNMKPIKWLKTTSKGTKVNFIPIMTEAEYEDGIEELEKHIEQVNKIHGTEFKIKRSV